MKPITFKFDVETFQGEQLDPAVQVSGTVDIPETKLEAAEQWPNDSTILNWLQSDIETRAKSKARATALSKHMENYKKSDAYKEKMAILSFRNLLGDKVENLSDAEVLDRARQLGAI